LLEKDGLDNVFSTLKNRFYRPESGFLEPRNGYSLTCPVAMYLCVHLSTVHELP